MAGEADFTDYLKAKPLETGRTVDAENTWTSYGTNNLIAGIVKTVFPDYVRHIKTKITAEEPEDFYTLASYGGLSGDKIKAGNLAKKDITTYTNKDGTPSKSGAKGSDSNEVMEDVTTMLHELYHGRIATAKVGSFKSPNLGTNWKEFIKDAGELGFPSIDSGVGGGDKLEEFLATAVPITQIRAMGMTPTGRWKGHAASLDKLQNKYPWVKNYINEFANVEQIKSVATALEEKQSSFIDLLFKK